MSKGKHMCNMKALFILGQQFWPILSLLLTDRWTDRQSDRVNPIHPQNFVCGGIINTTRVSVETGSSIGLFLFIYVQTFKSRKDIN